MGVNPMSCIVWRDGIGDSALEHLAGEEIAGIRAGLRGGGAIPMITNGNHKGSDGGQQVARADDSFGPNDVPLTYVVCQKRIATKFLTQNIPGHPDGKFGAPAGTL